MPNSIIQKYAVVNSDPRKNLDELEKCGRKDSDEIRFIPSDKDGGPSYFILYNKKLSAFQDSIDKFLGKWSSSARNRIEKRQAARKQARIEIKKMLQEVYSKHADAAFKPYENSKFLTRADLLKLDNSAFGAEIEEKELKAAINSKKESILHEASVRFPGDGSNAIRALNAQYGEEITSWALKKVGVEIKNNDYEMITEKQKTSLLVLLNNLENYCMVKKHKEILIIKAGKNVESIMENM
jgi:hypothetical protein